MEGKTSFEELAKEVFVDVFTAGRLVGKEAVAAEDWLRERDMATERLVAAHQTELDRRMLEARKDEMTKLRHRGPMNTIDVNGYINKRMIEIEGREK